MLPSKVGEAVSQREVPVPPAFPRRRGPPPADGAGEAARRPSGARRQPFFGRPGVLVHLSLDQCLLISPLDQRGMMGGLPQASARKPARLVGCRRAGTLSSAAIAARQPRRPKSRGAIATDHEPLKTPGDLQGQTQHNVHYRTLPNGPFGSGERGGASGSRDRRATTHLPVSSKAPMRRNLA